MSTTEEQAALLLSNERVLGNKRILDFLAQGIPPQQVLTIVGCTPKHINSLLQDVGFMAAVAEARKPYLVEANEEDIISNKHLSLEHKILSQIESQIGNAELRDAIRALEVVSNVRDKKAARKHTAPQSNVTNIQMIALNLPPHAIPEYSLNSNREVVAIDQNVMAPMTSNSVRDLFKGMQEGMKTVQAVPA